MRQFGFVQLFHGIGASEQRGALEPHQDHTKNGFSTGEVNLKFTIDLPCKRPATQSKGQDTSAYHFTMSVLFLYSA